jgi:NDP-sugar pyrophosphorylase family protein
MQGHRDVINRRVKVAVPGEEVQPGIWYGKSVNVAGTLRLRPPVVLGDWCEIGDDVSLGPNVVVGPGVRIGDGSSLANCVVHHNCTLGSRSQIKNCILDYGSQVWDDTALEGLMVGAYSSFAKGTKTSNNLQET